MGAHKHNPTAEAARNGELPPKAEKKSKQEIDRELNEAVIRAMMSVCPQALTMCMALGTNPYTNKHI